MKSAEQQAQAYELYLSGQTQRAICEILAPLEPRTLAGWVRRGGWVARRKEAQDELLTTVDEQYINWVKSKRLNIAKKQIEVSEKIIDHVEHTLDERELDKEAHGWAPQDLQYLARTFKDASDIQAKAVNITDKASIGLPSGDQGAGAPKLLLTVGAMPVATANQLPEPDLEKMINVTPEKDDAPW